MKSKGSLIFLILSVFLMGAAVPTLVIWNPAHWGWAQRFANGLRSHPAGSTGQQANQLWTCGMHPQVIQDRPGNCPICGMKLVPLKQETAASPGAASSTGGEKERKILYWRAPMDPNYISDKPGKSPMGMDLVPVYEDEQPTATGIRVDPGFLQNFAVRTAVVEKGAIPTEIRTVGVLTYNEKNIASVNTKFEGWIEKAYVNYIGEPVKKNQLLFEIYSPQLVTTQQEYLAALDYVSRLERNGAQPDAVDRARSLLEAARERLRYWDITANQIEQLRRTRKPSRTLKLYSPVSGIVVSKMDRAIEGMQLTPGMNVFRIADLSTVWAEIQIYEYQLQHVRLGQRARITVDAFPGRRWSGKIIYLDPALDRKTRTLKAFVEIPNPSLRLRPEMYANVEIRPPAVAGAVKIPEEAIIHTGERNIVIVEKDKGVFEPREVKLGITGDGFTEVRQGLRPGEVVVTSSQFLIDSESNLKEAVQKILAARSAKSEPAAAPAAEGKPQQ